MISPYVLPGLPRRQVYFKSPDLIARQIANELGVSWSELTSRSRRRNLVDARRIISYILTRYLSLTDVGKIINRDHASVLFVKRSCADLLETDYKFKNQYGQIISQYEKIIKDENSHI